MGHDYTRTDSAETTATPGEVWAAIATGGGIDSWFMGRNEVDGGPGGTIRGAFGGYAPTFRIHDWDPPHRLGYGADPAPDGRRIAYEFLVEARDGGSSVIRCVTSGFLPGDDWEDEFEAMTAGGDLFFRTLLEYVTRFAGRTATPVTAFGPPVTDWAAAWTALAGALGHPTRLVEGDHIRTPEITGVVYAANDQTLGIRTGTALIRFLRGFRGPLIAAHHLFGLGVDAEAEEQAWTAWLGRALAETQG